MKTGHKILHPDYKKIKDAYKFILTLLSFFSVASKDISHG